MQELKKYVFLYNLDKVLDEEMRNKICRAIPEAVVLNEERYQGEVYYNPSSQSIWVPEDKYLIAFAIANYNELLGITFWDEECETTADDGVEWFNTHRNDSFYVKWL